MKKKLISMLLAGAMVLSLAACGGGGGNANGGSGDSGDGGSAQTEGTDENAGGGSSDDNTLTVAAWDPAFNIPALKAAEADYQVHRILKPWLQQPLPLGIMTRCRTWSCSKTTGSSSM